MKTFVPYFLVIQRNTSQFIEAAGVEIPVWASESFPTTLQAGMAVAAFCGHDPESIERCDFVILEISPPPKDPG